MIVYVVTRSQERPDETQLMSPTPLPALGRQQLQQQPNTPALSRLSRQRTAGDRPLPKLLSSPAAAAAVAALTRPEYEEAAVASPAPSNDTFEVSEVWCEALYEVTPSNAIISLKGTTVTLLSTVARNFEHSFYSVPTYPIRHCYFYFRFFIISEFAQLYIFSWTSFYMWKVYGWPPWLQDDLAALRTILKGQ